MSLEVLGVVLGVVGILVSVGVAVWQFRVDRDHRRRRKAKRQKVELKAAKKRLEELEARPKPKK